MAREGKQGQGDKGKHRKQGNAVLNLTIDGSSSNPEVREVREGRHEAIATFQTPCTVNGLVAGTSGGVLGYAFGFRE